MGSYKNRGNTLPFSTTDDREKEIEIVNTVFTSMKRQGSGSELRGVPFYVAFMHTARGLKILENNSRPGDPEIMNILPLLRDDFADVCFRMVEGNLNKVELDEQASVVTYKAPPSYAGYLNTFPREINREEIDRPVKLEKAYALRRKLRDKIRVYPASMELRDSGVHALSSRAVALVGIAETIQEARELSLQGADAIEGGALWNRVDIASSEHIRRSVDHMENLRRKGK
jgi:phosphoribosylamine--glycine ligase